MILLDTHVLLWWFEQSSPLSSPARRSLEGAGTIFVSPLSLYEIGLLVTKERVRLDRRVLDWSRELLEIDRVTMAALTASVALIAVDLASTFPADPIDRLLYATALELGVPFVTKDRRIRSHAALARDVKVIW